MAEPDPKGGAPSTAEERGLSHEWPSPQIDALADQLEHDTGCSIYRGEFWDEMVCFDLNYRALRHGLQAWSPEAYEAVKRAQRRCQDFRESVRHAIDVNAPLEDLHAMLKETDRMEAAITRQIELVQSARSYRSGKQPRGLLFENTIYQLAWIYEMYTGRTAGTSTSRTRDGRFGPFVHFVESVLEIVEPDSQRAALGESIAKVQEVVTNQKEGTPAA